MQTSPLPFITVERVPLQPGRLSTLDYRVVIVGSEKRIPIAANYGSFKTAINYAATAAVILNLPITLQYVQLPQPTTGARRGSPHLLQSYIEAMGG